MAKVSVVSIPDLIRDEEDFRALQEALRREGKGDDRLCRMTFADFRQRRSIHDILREEMAGQILPNQH